MYNLLDVKLSIFPQGAIKKGKELTIKLYIPNSYGLVEQVRVLFNRQNEQTYCIANLNYAGTQNEISCFVANVTLERVGINYFCFSLLINGQTTYVKLDRETKCPCITNKNMPYFSVTIYHEDAFAPEWAKGAIMYHVFIDRFRKSNKTHMLRMKNRIIHRNWEELPLWESPDGKVRNIDFFGGDLRGVIESLGYLKKLGVTIIYLSPVMRSQSNHRYDTADYEQVDPYAGCNDDLKELCDEAHKKGMKVILDAVFNHTGNDSKYFNEYHTFDTIGAFDGPQSPYYDWYQKNGKSFCYWWGFKNLPVCNASNAQWQQYIYGEGGIIDKWFTLGIDGIRIDVADELTEEFLENIRNAVIRNKPDGFILGEVWENAITKQKYGRERTYLLGKSLNSVMNYPFTDAILKYIRFGDDAYFKYIVNNILGTYPPFAYQSMTNALSTHDIPRAITTLVGEGIFHNRYEWTWDIGEYSRNWQWRLEHDRLPKEQYKRGKRLLKLAILLQYFLPGTPCIFYGDEVGMQGYKDPFNRKTYPWGKRDKGLLKFYRKIGKVRSQLTFLKTAEFEWVKLDESIACFRRYDEQNSVIVAINRTESRIALPTELLGLKVLYKNNSEDAFLRPYGGVILQEK